jgi:hypothetical protein
LEIRFWPFTVSTENVILSPTYRDLSSSRRDLYAGRRQPLGPKDFDMKPEHEARRKIIREWMSLPKDKRQTEEQAKPFAKKAIGRIPFGGDPYRQILTWLLPRIGKP